MDGTPPGTQKSETSTTDGRDNIISRLKKKGGGVGERHRKDPGQGIGKKKVVVGRRSCRPGQSGVATGGCQDPWERPTVLSDEG